MIVINKIFWVFTILTSLMLSIFVVQDTYEVICRQYMIRRKYKGTSKNQLLIYTSDC